jgi:hypothetical protein
MLIGLTLALPAPAADGIREERVHFQAGTSQATLKGHLRGDSDVDYLLGAKAGQRMTVELHSDNPRTTSTSCPRATTRRFSSAAVPVTASRGPFRTAATTASASI